MTEQAVRHRGVLFGALLLGAGVSVALGAYGRWHSPVYGSLPAFGFSSTATFKAWAASGVLVLAVGQLVSALWLFGRLPWLGRAPTWLGVAHRAGGSAAVLLSLPVAAYCLYEFGFAPEPFSARTLAHSVAGCALYGALVAKVVLVRSLRVPGWAIPVAGSALMVSVVLVWLTSSLWLFSETGMRT